jgi:hypothetical protein
LIAFSQFRTKFDNRFSRGHDSQSIQIIP